MTMQAIIVTGGKQYNVKAVSYTHLALFIDITRKLGDLLRRDEAFLHELGEARNRGERCFELMRHVRGKLAAEPVSLLALGHVHKKDHCARHLSGGHNGVDVYKRQLHALRDVGHRLARDSGN